MRNFAIGLRLKNESVKLFKVVFGIVFTWHNSVQWDHVILISRATFGYHVLGTCGPNYMGSYLPVSCGDSEHCLSVTAPCSQRAGFKFTRFNFGRPSTFEGYCSVECGAGCESARPPCDPSPDCDLHSRLTLLSTPP